MNVRIDSFLQLALEQGGSDLHLVSGEAPRVRIHGQLQEVRFRPLAAEDVESMLIEILDERQVTELQSENAIDFAYLAPGLGRFRCNFSRHARGCVVVLRAIPSLIPTIDSLQLPSSLKLAVSQPKGMILVTGPTGSGKSTTLAALVDHINESRKGHIITLEDPIEFVHDYKQCVITQREVGSHVQSFADGVRSALREDPDVILVGELRDPETIGLAVTAAETGIQVLGTLHTSGAARAISRILNVFPAGRREQVRVMLADSLRMVVSQILLRTPDQQGRVAASEVLMNTHAVASMIRTGNAHKLESVLQTGAAAGMQSMDSCLRRLVDEGWIDGEEAYYHATDKSAFSRFVARQNVA